MNTSEFEATLAQEGYTEVLNREMEANKFVAEHEHSFDARLFILDGELTITSNGQTTTYRSGDEFSMPAGCKHIEQTGSEGARYIVGRRQPVKFEN